jgi:VanZ family protein
MVLCWMPGHLVREVEDESSWFDIPHLDKVVHCVIFAIFSVLWHRVRPSRWMFVWVILSGFALAVLTEIVQSVPWVGRDTSVGDMVTDVIGVLLGVAAAPLVEPLALFLEARLLRKTTTAAVPVAAEPATEARS